MSDTAWTQLALIITAAIGFATLWLKVKHGTTEAKDAAEKAESAATQAAAKAEVVEQKLDDNTATTQAVNVKTDTIVQQTDGSLDAIRALVLTIAERVAKLEDYNRDSAHRVLDAVNAMHLRLAEILALCPKPVVVTPVVKVEGSK